MEIMTCNEKKVLDEIRTSMRLFTNFGYNIKDDNDDNVYYCVQPLFKTKKVQYAKGVTKMCLIPPTGNWVMKVPFQGEYVPVWNDDIEDYEDDFAFESYCGAENGTPNHWNYCLSEVYCYDLAEEGGVSEFFAREEYFGEVATSSKETLPCYVQEKCYTVRDVWDHDAPQASEDSLKKVASNEKYRYCNFCNEWLATAIDYYGEEKVLALLKFLDEHYWMSGDFHEGNYGYRASDNSPVLIDYTGFNN